MLSIDYNVLSGYASRELLSVVGITEDDFLIYINITHYDIYYCGLGAFPENVEM
jgi:hypothetical protein